MLAKAIESNSSTTKWNRESNQHQLV
jgi:hypothetical protein